MKVRLFASLLAGAMLLAACADSEDQPEQIELSAGGGVTMMSCLPFDPAYLADMPLAFRGTATEVTGDVVTLKVDHWFRGGDAEEVVLRAPQGLEALIDGIAFETDREYLISATDGQVNYCGFSGEVTPELEAGFEAAFEG